MKVFALDGVSLRGIYGIGWRQFFRDLWQEIQKDNLFNGSAALAYYFFFSLFPAMIFLLSLLPYLPIPNLHASIMGLLSQFMPGEAYQMFSGTINEITNNPQGGLLSIGALLTLWAASTGFYAIMQHLNFTYDVNESRPYWKARGTAVLLTLASGTLIIGALGLVLLGEVIHNWLVSTVGLQGPLLSVFAVAQWIIIASALFLGFALNYHFGPDVKQEFRFITLGSIMGVLLLVAASLGFKFYVSNFGSYNATYGSIGAVIVLMLWLNILGLVILFGSEVNALVEHYSPQGKVKGQKNETGEGQGRSVANKDIDRPELAPREEYAS